MSDDIGSYYDRKRIEAAQAWQRELNHRATCATCKAHDPSGHHGSPRCQVLKRLKKETDRAAYTGD